MVINKALEKEDEMELRAALENPAAMLAKVAMSSVPRYLPCLVEAKQVKVTQSGVQVRGRGKGRGSVYQIGKGMCRLYCTQPQPLSGHTEVAYNYFCSWHAF